MTYITAHSNAKTLTQWVRPGIEPASSWMLVGFINHWARQELQNFLFFFLRLINIPLYGYIIFCLSTHLLMDILVVSTFCLLDSFGCTLRGEIAGSYGNSMPNFLRNCPAVFHSGCTILHPYQWCIKLPISLHWVVLEAFKLVADT